MREVSDFNLISLIASNVILSLPETYPVAGEVAIDELVRAALREPLQKSVASDRDIICSGVDYRAWVYAEPVF